GRAGGDGRATAESGGAVQAARRHGGYGSTVGAGHSASARRLTLERTPNYELKGKGRRGGRLRRPFKREPGQGSSRARILRGSPGGRCGAATASTLAPPGKPLARSSVHTPVGDSP